MNNKRLCFLIDDDLDDQEIFSIAMQQIDSTIQCEFAKDGLYALDRFKADHTFMPDYIFLDINMPRMDGIECLTEIKKQPHIAAIPVYIYSTSANADVVAKCMRLGATDFIQKISDIDKLQQCFKRIIFNS